MRRVAVAPRSLISSAPLLLALTGCAEVQQRPADRSSPKQSAADAAPPVATEIPMASAQSSQNDADAYAKFRDYGRLEAQLAWHRGRSRSHPESSSEPVRFGRPQHLQSLVARQTVAARNEFFKGRYNRSRARSPTNIERWRQQPDIANPGPDLANFPNSAFTLPQGRAYIEFSPFTYYGSSKASAAQYNSEFLLRYGITDDIEARLFSNGISWTGGANQAWGFSPIAFDTKIQLWTEKPEYFLPAAALEAYVQTEWLGSKAFNGGTQPSVSFNFDQSLPLDIDLEYNLGILRVRDAAGNNDWQFAVQWAFQRDLFNQDFSVFVHGFFNAMTLPRLPAAQLAAPTGDLDYQQNGVGAGFLWTPSQWLALYGQCSGGTTRFTPSLMSLFGLAVAF